LRAIQHVSPLAPLDRSHAQFLFASVRTGRATLCGAVEFTNTADNALRFGTILPICEDAIFRHGNAWMMVPGKRLLALAWLCTLVVFASVAAFASEDWQIIKVGGHDYLSVDNIAHFYGLPPSVISVRNKISLEDAGKSLEFTPNSREVLINGVRNWLCFPVLDQGGKFLVSRMDLAKTIEPQLRPHLISNLEQIQTVVLDPGHGGYDKGATSRYGCEKDFALDVARKLRPLLQAEGLRVIMTRESDAFVPLEVRARIANATHNSIFVSIHFNDTDRDPNATGFEIYSLTPRGAPSSAGDSVDINTEAGNPVDTQSVALSACIYHSLLGHIQEFDRGIKRARFAVLRLTKIPAVLVEGGFLTEHGESRLIANKDWRAKLAAAIGIGIENYKELADTKHRPMILAEYRRQAPPEQVTEEPSPTPTPEEPSPTPTATPSLLSAVIVP
jgi:N-acetylmuramoyl-L-alanine amidase